MTACKYAYDGATFVVPSAKGKDFLLKCLLRSREDVEGEDLLARAGKPTSSGRTWNSLLECKLNIPGFIDQVLQAVVIGSLDASCHSFIIATGRP